MTASSSWGRWNRCRGPLSSYLRSCTPARRCQLRPDGPCLLDKGRLPTGCVPAGAITPQATATIGEITVGDTGLTVVCDYEHVLELAKSKACAEGADAVQLLEVKSRASSALVTRFAPSS